MMTHLRNRVIRYSPLVTGILVAFSVLASLAALAIGSAVAVGHRKQSKLFPMICRASLSLMLWATIASHSNCRANGYLFISSDGTGDVKRYDATTGQFINAVGSPGSLVGPRGLAIGADGRLYVAANNRVTRFDINSGQLIDRFDQSSPITLNNVEGIKFGPNGNFFVNSWSSGQILQYNGATGAFVSEFVSAGQITPEGLAFGPDGNLYVSGSFTAPDEILRFDGHTGTFIDKFVTRGSGGLARGEGLAFGPDGNLFVCSSNSNSILRYNGTTGAFIDAFVPNGSGGLSGPLDLTFGPGGNLYVNSRYTNSVLRYNGTTGASLGTFVASGSGGLSTPTYLLFSSNVPEPSTLLLAALALVPFAWRRRGVLVRSYSRATSFRFAALLIALLAALVSANSVSAQPLFSEDFEAGLSRWTGKNNALHHGIIVNDPLRTGNHVLTFTALNGAGDIFTAQQFDLILGQPYVLSFEYLGLPTHGSVANDLGGAFGISEDLPGRHAWLYATSPTEPPVLDNLVDDGQWRTYSTVLTAPVQFVFYGGGTGTRFHLMTEDYDGNGVAGDVYYDNIRFSSVIPEPSTLLLAALALVPLAWRMRRPEATTKGLRDIGDHVSKVAGLAGVGD